MIIIPEKERLNIARSTSRAVYEQSEFPGITSRRWWWSGEPLLDAFRQVELHPAAVLQSHPLRDEQLIRPALYTKMMDDFWSFAITNKSITNNIVLWYYVDDGDDSAPGKRIKSAA